MLYQQYMFIKESNEFDLYKSNVIALTTSKKTEVYIHVCIGYYYDVLF